MGFLLVIPPVVACCQCSTLACYITNQGCALRNIVGSPVLWTCEKQGAKHQICMGKLRFPSCSRSKAMVWGPLTGRCSVEHQQWNLDIMNGQGTGNNITVYNEVSFYWGFFVIYFTIMTGVNKIFCYTGDFVI